jgi:hypothetical protein
VAPFCPEYNAAIKLRDELNEEHARWPASGLCRKFKRAVVYILTALVAIVIVLATR